MERTTDKAVLERIEKNPRYSGVIKAFDMGVAIIHGKISEFKDCRSIWEIAEKTYGYIHESLSQNNAGESEEMVEASSHYLTNITIMAITLLNTCKFSQELKSDILTALMDYSDYLNTPSKVVSTEEEVETAQHSYLQ